MSIKMIISIINKPNDIKITLTKNIETINEKDFKYLRTTNNIDKGFLNIISSHFDKEIIDIITNINNKVNYKIILNKTLNETEKENNTINNNNEDIFINLPI
jgi:hypothetical protein